MSGNQPPARGDVDWEQWGRHELGVTLMKEAEELGEPVWRLQQALWDDDPIGTDDLLKTHRNLREFLVTLKDSPVYDLADDLDDDTEQLIEDATDAYVDLLTLAHRHHTGRANPEEYEHTQERLAEIAEDVAELG